MRFPDFLRFVTKRSGAPQFSEAERWREDPLSHPDLRNLSSDQLADLPLEPFFISGDGTARPTTNSPAQRRVP